MRNYGSSKGVWTVSAAVFIFIRVNQTRLKGETLHPIRIQVQLPHQVGVLSYPKTSPSHVVLVFTFCMSAENRPILAHSSLFHFYVTGNGSMPPFANNAPPGAPRDSSFGGMGRPNGRAPGNGAPQVTVAGPPAASKSSVTISNGRDPRRAKRWNWGSGMSPFLSALSQVPPSQPMMSFQAKFSDFCIIFTQDNLHIFRA